jgi:HTH-type transcriptional regulator/antitoxin HipB
VAYAIRVPSQLSSHLRALRKAKGWSQAELGARLGLSQARVARIEGAPLSISVEQLMRVLAALGVSVGLEPSAAAEPEGVSAAQRVGRRTPKPTAKRARDEPDW